MNIYTSYFGNAKALAKYGIKIVSVARWQPRYLRPDFTMLEVAPTVWMLKEATYEQYVETYRRILSNVNAHDFINRLEMYSGGNDIALCCYETPDKFCHRHMLAEYLTARTGVVIEEFVTPAPPPEPPKVEKIEPPSLFDDL